MVAFKWSYYVLLHPIPLFRHVTFVPPRLPRKGRRAPSAVQRHRFGNSSRPVGLGEQKRLRPWSSNQRKILTAQTSKNVGSWSSASGTCHFLLFFWYVPLLQCCCTITFQPRCFGRALLLPASATVLRDANEFVVQKFSKKCLLHGQYQKGSLFTCLRQSAVPSVSICFLPSFSSRHPYTNLIPSNFSHHLAHKMPNYDIQTI